jgi:hypothetical protein
LTKQRFWGDLGRFKEILREFGRFREISNRNLQPIQTPNQKSNPKHKQQKTSPKNKANLPVIKLSKYWKESDNTPPKFFRRND